MGNTLKYKYIVYMYILMYIKHANLRFKHHFIVGIARTPAATVPAQRVHIKFLYTLEYGAFKSFMFF